MENDKKQGRPIFSILDMINTNSDYILPSNMNPMEEVEIKKVETQSQQEELPTPAKEETDKFVQFARFAHPSKQEGDDQDSRILSLPSIPSEIFDKLPKLLQEGCKVFTDEKERDVYLTGSLGVLSGCIPGISGTYDRRKVYANLNVFAIAPPASGKGALVFAKAMGQAYHDKIYKASKMAISQYEKMKKTITDEQAGVMEEPKAKMLYIPGNISAAALIKNLHDYDGKGILCETEADTIAHAMKQDWGGFSDIIRKVAHHEAISSSRKTNNEVIQVEKPQLSIVISGTPSQVTGLIKSVEDGLFSRFMFYTYKSKPEWRDVSPVPGEPSLTDYFEVLSNKVLSMIEFVEQCPSDFQLTPQQYDKLNEYFKGALEKLNILVGEDVDSCVKRHGLITYRIAMVLSAIRKYENGDKSTKLLCTDEDFDIAMKLTEVYLQHSIYVMSCLPKADKIKNNGAHRLYEALPSKFQRSEAIEIGKKLGMASRTTDKHLKALFDSQLLKQDTYGTYQKV